MLGTSAVVFAALEALPGRAPEIVGKRSSRALEIFNRGVAEEQRYAGVAAGL